MIEKQNHKYLNKPEKFACPIHLISASYIITNSFYKLTYSFLQSYIIPATVRQVKLSRKLYCTIYWSYSNEPRVTLLLLHNNEWTATWNRWKACTVRLYDSCVVRARFNRGFSFKYCIAKIIWWKESSRIFWSCQNVCGLVFRHLWSSLSPSY